MDAMNTTMTLRDISELLKISEQTARTRVRQGKAMPPSFKAGQRRLFLTSEVQKWLIAQTSASGGPSASDGQAPESRMAATAKRSRGCRCRAWELS